MLVRLARQQELGLGQKLEKVKTLEHTWVYILEDMESRSLSTSPTEQQLPRSRRICMVETQCDCNVFAAPPTNASL
jgi:hypothetical protein